MVLVRTSIMLDKEDTKKLIKHIQKTKEYESVSHAIRSFIRSKING